MGCCEAGVLQQQHSIINSVTVGLYEMISGDRMCVLYMLIRVISNNGL